MYCVYIRIYVLIMYIYFNSGLLTTFMLKIVRLISYTLVLVYFPKIQLKLIQLVVVTILLHQTSPYLKHCRYFRSYCDSYLSVTTVRSLVHGKLS